MDRRIEAGSDPAVVLERCSENVDAAELGAADPIAGGDLEHAVGIWGDPVRRDLQVDTGDLRRRGGQGLAQGRTVAKLQRGVERRLEEVAVQRGTARREDGGEEDGGKGRVWSGHHG